jgi:AcrR family transcriptional regulator
MTESASSARWRRRKAARPAEIVDAALACFSERGFAATRLEDIARRAGVTKGTLYLYFQSKEDLFKEVVRAAVVPRVAYFEQLAAMVERPVPDILRQMITGWPATMTASPVSAIPKLVIGEAGNFPELARFYLDEVIHRALRVIESLLRRGVEQGHFRRDLDVSHTVFSIVTPLMFTMVWKHSLGPHDSHPMDVEAVCRAHCELLLQGLLVRTERPA